MSFLVDILPARARRIVYWCYGLLGLLIGAVPVYCGATSQTVPDVIVGALAVYAFVGGSVFGATAGANVSVGEHARDR
jgi:hypothetical protein